ncbi:MAG: glycosyl hydrolase 108 family protein [Bacteroidota bacterium]
MASFEKAIANTFKAEGGFQSDPTDTANYVNGICIGTNRGISASGYYAYFKQIPTVEVMKNISIEDAKRIFKGNYWDKVGGDFIINQSVAELMFQFIIGSGASQISDIKDIANGIDDKDLIIMENDNPIIQREIIIINALDQAKFHAALWKWRLAFYDLVVLKNPKKEKFLKGWQNRLLTHKFIA